MTTISQDERQTNSLPDTSEESRHIRIAAEMAAELRLFEWSDKDKKIEHLHSLDVPSVQLRPHTEDCMFATLDVYNTKKYLLYFRNLGEHSYELIIGNYWEHGITMLSTFDKQYRKVIRMCSRKNLKKMTAAAEKITFHDFLIDSEFVTMFEPFRQHYIYSSHYSFTGNSEINYGQVDSLSRWNITKLEFSDEMIVTDRMLTKLHYSSVCIHGSKAPAITNATIHHWMKFPPREIQIEALTKFTFKWVFALVEVVVFTKTTKCQPYSWQLTVLEEDKNKIEKELRKTLAVTDHGGKLYVSSALKGCLNEVHLQLTPYQLYIPRPKISISTVNEFQPEQPWGDEIVIKIDEIQRNPPADVKRKSIEDPEVVADRQRRVVANLATATTVATATVNRRWCTFSSLILFPILLFVALYFGIED